MVEATLLSDLNDVGVSRLKNPWTPMRLDSAKRFDNEDPASALIEVVCRLGCGSTSLS